MMIDRFFTTDPSRVNSCPRCAGLLMCERLPFHPDLQWRCCSCGNVLDTLILVNRLSAPIIKTTPNPRYPLGIFQT